MVTPAEQRDGPRRLPQYDDVRIAVARPHAAVRVKRLLARLGATSIFIAAAMQAHAQDTSTGARRYAPPPRIHWTLTVVSDGKETDSWSGTTAVGQSSTVTRHWQVTHTVGCEGAETQPVSYSRTVSVSPLGVDAQQVIGFAVDTQETVEDRTNRVVRSDGCALPPSARTVTARHPEWDVTSGQSASWTLIPHDPTLVYRLQANVVSSSASASTSADPHASSPADAPAPVSGSSSGSRSGEVPGDARQPSAAAAAAAAAMNTTAGATAPPGRVAP